MNQTSIKKLSEIIVKAIIEEPYFNKEILTPKIKALIVGFRLDLDVTNYNVIKDENKTANLIRSNQLHNLEKDFWKQELKNIVGKEKMNEYYLKLDEKRLIWKGE